MASINRFQNYQFMNAPEGERRMSARATQSEIGAQRRRHDPRRERKTDRDRLPCLSILPKQSPRSRVSFSARRIMSRGTMHVITIILLPPRSRWSSSLSRRIGFRKRRLRFRRSFCILKSDRGRAGHPVAQCVSETRIGRLFLSPFAFRLQ